MKRKQVLAVGFSLFCLAFIVAKPAFSYTQPTFSTCLNPNGVYHFQTVGTHGVAGDPSTYQGTDDVYALNGNGKDILSSSAVMQCLCPSNGQGIQTNWWLANDLSQGDIKVLLSQGWIFIPDGSAWGLNSAPYLAQNTNYSCGSNPGNSNNNNNNNSNNNTNKNDPGNSNSSNGVTQAVLGAFTELAYTGNFLLLFILTISGLLSTGLAFLIRKKS